MAALLGLHSSARPVRPDSSHNAATIASRPSAAPNGRQRRAVVVAAGSNGGGGGLGDELLDFMYAGKKLRKWYGAEGQVLPRDGRQPDDEPEAPQEEEEEPAVREYVAVLDADTSPMAEQARPACAPCCHLAKDAAFAPRSNWHCGNSTWCQQHSAFSDARGHRCARAHPPAVHPPPRLQVVLQLILNRTKIRALVKDAAAAKAAFGPYIEPVQASPAPAIGGGEDGRAQLMWLRLLHSHLRTPLRPA